MSAANKLVGLIRRSIISLDKKSFVTLFKSLIRSKLEYNNAAWCTYTKNDILKIEAVQRRATKMLPGLRNMLYPDRLRALQLPTLIYRRLRGDCIQVYKYLHVHYDVNWSNLINLNNSVEYRYDTRGHKFKLRKTSHKTIPREKFFAVRVINNWNSLPEDVVFAPSFNNFKNQLDNFWSKNPLKFDPDCL